MKVSRQLLGRIAVGLVILYAALTAALFAAMRQPPEVFGKIMSKMPTAGLVLLPFRPLWMVARAGHLKVGDAAPGFSLETLDRKSRVQLSSHRGQKPVVLVFGSYT